MNQPEAETAMQEQKLVVAKGRKGYLVGRLISRAGGFFGFKATDGTKFPLQPASSFSLYRT